jgi:hypothetical protein
VLRRRARAITRLARPVLSPSFYPVAPVTPAYWWDGHPNFGDALTPWLLRHHGRIAVHTAPGAARMAGVGSILEQLPPEFSGTVWGSGLLYGERVELPHATYAAVRGHLTRQVQGIREPVAVGDPGVLVARHVRRPRRRWTLGVVPHGMHDDHPDVLAFAERYPGDVRVIGTRAPVETVVRAIGRCDAVISSSLHGLVVADSFGIPAAWFELSPALWGGSFKFDDYESVVTPGRTRRLALEPGLPLSTVLAATDGVSADLVAATGDALVAALDQVPSVVVPPFRALRARRHH